MRSMKALIAALLLVGCAHGVTDAESTAGGTPPSPEYTVPEQPESYDGPCGAGYSTESLVVDGVKVMLRVPALCDPYWQDHGDPPPREFRPKLELAPVLPERH